MAQFSRKINKKTSSVSKDNQRAIKEFISTGGDIKDLLSHEKLKQSFALFEKIKITELVIILFALLEVN